MPDRRDEPAEGPPAGKAPDPAHRRPGDRLFAGWREELATCRKFAPAARNYTACRLLSEVGLRVNEACKLDLPDVTFANDVTVMADALYVSDNRSDQLVRIEPADFLESKAAPKITVLFKEKSINPNGIYPGKDGALLMVGFKGKDDPRGIYSVVPGKEPELLSDKIGMLDGLYAMSNGDLLATDWMTGSLFQWNKAMGVKKLATDFKGPADLCAFPNAKGLMVVVPDLVKGELRFVQLGK